MASQDRNYISTIKKLRGRPKPTGEYAQTYQDPNNGKVKDARNSALKELDAPHDEIGKMLQHEKGKFEPEEETSKEDALDAVLRNKDMGLSEERKKKYLNILQKRMRTS